MAPDQIYWNVSLRGLQVDGFLTDITNPTEKFKAKVAATKISTFSIVLHMSVHSVSP
jgi:hypothetical protein